MPPYRGHKRAQHLFYALDERDLFRRINASWYFRGYRVSIPDGLYRASVGDPGRIPDRRRDRLSEKDVRPSSDDERRYVRN
ncbi:hypothetical protein LTR53_014952, partial [Teratosphaeriaceae sp. CCFEE 6253]